MFRKSKIEPVEKVKIVERYLAGEIGIRQAGKELGVDHHSIRNWISIYQYDGPTCKLCLNGMPVPLLRNCYSIFNGTKYR